MAAKPVILRQPKPAAPKAAPAPAAPLPKPVPVARSEHDIVQEIRARLIDDLMAVNSVYDLNLIDVAAEAIVDGDNGAMCPAECFLRSLIEHQWKHELSPELALEQLKNFQDDFKRMRNAARDFQEHYGI